MDRQEAESILRAEFVFLTGDDFITPAGLAIICEAALAALDAAGACDGQSEGHAWCERWAEHHGYRLLWAALELTRGA